MNKKISFLFITLILLLGCKHRFIIDTIKVNELKYIQNEWIMKTTNELIGKNLLTVNLNKIIDKLYTNRYIKKINYEKILPNILNITIEEKQVVGYVINENKSYDLLEDGMIVSSNSKRGIHFILNNMNENKYLKMVIGRIKSFVIPSDSEESTSLKKAIGKIQNINVSLEKVIIKKREIEFVLRNGFIVKLDRNLEGIDKMNYINMIKGQHLDIKEKIIGIDLRFNKMGILMLGGIK